MMTAVTERFKATIRYEAGERVEGCRDETDIVRGTSGTPVTPVLRDFPVSFPPICCTCRARKQRKHTLALRQNKYDFCFKMSRNVSTFVVYVVEMST